MLEKSATIEDISEIGYKSKGVTMKDKKYVKIDFKYPDKTQEKSGTKDIRVETSCLKLEPIPALLIDEVDVSFEMEIKRVSAPEMEGNSEILDV